MSEKKWYVVVHEFACDPEPDPDEAIWTVSTDPSTPGWETDMGHSGYGLLKADAEFLAQAANEKIARDGG